MTVRPATTATGTETGIVIPATVGILAMPVTPAILATVANLEAPGLLHEQHPRETSTHTSPAMADGMIGHHTIVGAVTAEKTGGTIATETVTAGRLAADHPAGATVIATRETYETNPVITADRIAGRKTLGTGLTQRGAWMRVVRIPWHMKAPHSRGPTCPT